MGLCTQDANAVLHAMSAAPATTGTSIAKYSGHLRLRPKVQIPYGAIANVFFETLKRAGKLLRNDIYI